MNKNRLLLFTMLTMALSLTIWSCEDEFSVEEQLRLQAELDKQAREDAQEKDSIALSILVYNASVSTHSNGGRSSSIQGTTGVTVNVSAQGETQTQTTNAEGIATFWVQPGSISGTLSGTGFATANFTITVEEDEDYEQGSGEDVTNASVSLPVFANTGSTTAKVSGRVTYEGNFLNNEQELVPDGTVLTFRPNATSLQAYYSSITPNVADIDAYSFEGTFIATTTNGEYSIDLPTGANGLDYAHQFSEFTADQNIAINNYANETSGSVRDVVTLRATFGQSLTGGFTTVPFIQPVQFDIDAPPAPGSGATVNLRLFPQDVDASGSYTVMAKGSGYPTNSTTVPVTINGGDFDNTVLGATVAAITANTNALGQVTSLNITTPGYGYRSRPTLTIGGGGSGAVVRLDWESTIVSDSYPEGPSTITAGGSGYLEDNPPVILVTGYNFDGDLVSFPIGVDVSNGSVVSINPTGALFSGIVSAVVISPATSKATASGYVTNNEGQITFVNLTAVGSGYSHSTPPNVTVRSLRGGSGAVINTLVQNHSVNGLNIINKGSGYPAQGNANYPTGNINFSPNSANLNLVAGQQKILDAYYGTGRRSRDIN